MPLPFFVLKLLQMVACIYSAVYSSPNIVFLALYPTSLRFHKSFNCHLMFLRLIGFRGSTDSYALPERRPMQLHCGLVLLHLQVKRWMRTDGLLNLIQMRYSCTFSSNATNCCLTSLHLFWFRAGCFCFCFGSG